MPLEEAARQQIDALFVSCGWVVQDAKKLNLGAGQGVAVREVSVVSGRADYLLFVDRQPVGVVEAKKVGTTLTSAEEQSSFYAGNLPKFLLGQNTGQLPFVYESTGVETFFRDKRDPEPCPRRVFAFHRPETLAGWLAEPNTLRARLAQMPFVHPLTDKGMRACQVEALTKLEQSFAQFKPRALVQMATGAGKTFTACAETYRLIKYAKAKRVLFLVDRANLGRQAVGEFHSFVTPDTGRKFTELYNVERLASNRLDGVPRVTVCTIQRLYSILRGDAELPEDLDERSTAELSNADQRPKDVAYNPHISIEAFDFIVTDECHRSIYNLWRQVLEYFDAFLVGLTATPAKQTIAFFGLNLVMEYGHERAVADGVNVGYDVYRIQTEVTSQGGQIEKGFVVDKRSRATRQLRAQLLDEDVAYAANELDRSVVVPAQIRTVLQAYKDAVFTELFPGRSLVPKTLVFAKDDSHAEDVVRLCREVFGKGNDFCKKITYQAKHAATGKAAKSEDLIQEFRLSPTLRVAVTVDMIATGTDIKPLEVLLFLRDVRSRVYFEQMKGRGTRVLSPTDLKAVSGEEAKAKERFIIVDAVGVCESDKTESRPLDRQPGVAFEKILTQVAMNDRSEATLTSLASRLARLDRAILPARRAELAALAGGKTLAELSAALLRAFDPDAVAEAATGRPGANPAELATDQFEATQKKLLAAACTPFDEYPLREALTKARQEADQIIDGTTVDRVLHAGFDQGAKEKAAGLVAGFRAYLEAHKAEIEALQILYSRPYAGRLTERILKDLEKTLRAENAAFNEETLWSAFVATRPDRVRGRTQAARFADLIPLVRFALEQQPVLAPFADSVHERFAAWLGQKEAASTVFSTDQRAWLELIRDHIATSLSIEAEDFDYAPFNQRGGRGKAHQLFGGSLSVLLDELNEVLAA